MVKVYKYLGVYGMILLSAVILSSCSSNSQSPTDSSPVGSGTSQSSDASTSTSTSTSAATTTSASTMSTRTFKQVKQVYFSYNMYSLNNNTTSYLDDQVKFIQTYLNNNPKGKITLSGYADERGSIQYNLALGQRRATSVMNYLQNELQTAGITLTQGQLHMVSYGERHPFAVFSSTDNQVRECVWAMNRRVLTTFGKTADMVAPIRFDPNNIPTDSTDPLTMAMQNVDECSSFISSSSDTMNNG